MDKELVDLIKKGLARDNRFTVEEVLHELGTGKYQLFRYPDGIVITQLGEKKLLVFLLSGSDIESWKHQATQDLVLYANSLGLDTVEAYCRPGLEKKLKDCGWKKTNVVLRLQKQEASNAQSFRVRRG